MSQVHWLALAALPGLGSATLRKLLRQFGDVESIFLAAPEELAAIPRVTLAMAEQLHRTPLDTLEEELYGLAESEIDLLTWEDPRFPQALRALRDVPIVLFVSGALKREDEDAVAIVGTRTPSAEGIDLAVRLARELAARGLTVVSGLARGVDTAAHQGALAAEEGRTIAVLGSGIRNIHPRENAELAGRIAGHGAVISELMPETPARGPLLMARDRIISGLSRAVIVIEAGTRSGSLDTAARAHKQSRLIYAVPGSPGTDGLLRTVAKPLEVDASMDELVEEIRSYSADNPPAPPEQQPRLL